MVKSLLESWKASRALNFHSEPHKPYLCDILRELRDNIVLKEAENGKARKLTNLADYWQTCEAYWTHVYDLGHVQESTLESLGITVESRSLQAVETGEQLYTKDDVYQIRQG